MSNCRTDTPDLPPLPKAMHLAGVDLDSLHTSYTAGQMQAYAREAVRLAARASVPAGWKLVPIKPATERAERDQLTEDDVLVLWQCAGGVLPFARAIAQAARAAAPRAQPAPAYSAPFTDDVPQCCGDPANCNDPCEPAPDEHGKCTLCGSTKHRETCDSPGAILTFTTGCPVHDAKCRTPR